MFVVEIIVLVLACLFLAWFAPFVIATIIYESIDIYKRPRWFEKMVAFLQFDWYELHD